MCLFLNYGVQNVEEITLELPSTGLKTLKSMTCLTSLASKPMPVVFIFPLFLADLDKKYGNEIEKDEK